MQLDLSVDKLWKVTEQILLPQKGSVTVFRKLELSMGNSVENYSFLLFRCHLQLSILI